jgi:hypothetical protein
MVREIEFSKLDMRYEKHRMRQRAAEARLLSSIAERGIIEPLEGVNVLAYEQICRELERRGFCQAWNEIWIRKDNYGKERRLIRQNYSRVEI